MMLVLLINSQTKKSQYPDLYPAAKAVSCIGRAPTLRSMHHIVNGPPINLLRRVERQQAVPAPEARCAGHPSVWHWHGGASLRRQDHPFESCLVRYKIKLRSVSVLK
jgi:hypothetical protein